MDILTTRQKGDGFDVKITFQNDDGAAVTPTSPTWSLSDSGGTIINSRDAVDIDPAETMYITIGEDDLPWDGSEPGALYELRLIVEATVTSSYTGESVPKRKEVIIYVEDTANE